MREQARRSRAWSPGREAPVPPRLLPCRTAMLSKRRARVRMAVAISPPNEVVCSLRASRTSAREHGLSELGRLRCGRAGRRSSFLSGRSSRSAGHGVLERRAGEDPPDRPPGPRRRRGPAGPPPSRRAPPTRRARRHPVLDERPPDRFRERAGDYAVDGALGLVGQRVASLAGDCARRPQREALRCRTRPAEDPAQPSGVVLCVILRRLRFVAMPERGAYGRPSHRRRADRMISRSSCGDHRGISEQKEFSAEQARRFGRGDRHRLVDVLVRRRPVPHRHERRARAWAARPGTNVHGDDPLVTAKIALAHLNEFPATTRAWSRWRSRRAATGADPASLGAAAMADRATSTATTVTR